MKLETNYKDVTFETLNNEGFLEDIKKAYPQMDWDKADDEFKAAREEQSLQN